MDSPVHVVVVEESEATPAQKQEVLRLQVACFSGQVAAGEVEEDFCRPRVALVLARHQDELVACAEVFQREVEYEGHRIALGGFGPCTREDVRGRGIGTLVCQAAMDYLRECGCDMVFLSVDRKRRTYPLYERLGFTMLPRPFIYASIRGEIKESDRGMIAPLCSPELHERVLHGKTPLALTPEPGYW